jgi:hypothetical protein
MPWSKSTGNMYLLALHNFIGDNVAIKNASEQQTKEENAGISEGMV